MMAPQATATAIAAANPSQGAIPKCT